MINCEKISA